MLKTQPVKAPEAANSQSLPARIQPHYRPFRAFQMTRSFTSSIRAHLFPLHRGLLLLPTGRQPAAAPARPSPGGWRLRAISPILGSSSGSGTFRVEHRPHGHRLPPAKEMVVNRSSSWRGKEGRKGKVSGRVMFVTLTLTTAWIRTALHCHGREKGGEKEKRGESYRQTAGNQPACKSVREAGRDQTTGK